MNTILTSEKRTDDLLYTYHRVTKTVQGIVTSSVTVYLNFIN